MGWNKKTNENPMYELARAAVTKNHTLRVLHNRRFLSHSSGAQNSRRLLWVVSSVGCEGQSVAWLPPSFGQFGAISGIPWLVDASARSLPLCSHRYFFPVCRPVFKFSLFKRTTFIMHQGLTLL